jgi:imidazole glycerol-phosphate synthase subunit HisF
VLRPRVIPCLLLANGRLVKTVRFRDPAYVGDPVNIVNIFSALVADEILLLDIEATRQGRAPDIGQIAKLAEETMVPLGYGGGIRTLDHVRAVLNAGVEKVVLNTIAGEDPGFIERAAGLAGSQAVVVSIDVARDEQGRQRAWLRNGTCVTGHTPVEAAREAESRGAGEILIHAIDCDGTMAGYDLALIAEIAGAVRIPVIACGGAGERDHLRAAIREGGASAAAAGSIFVFQGPSRNVLVNYFGPAEHARFPA